MLTNPYWLFQINFLSFIGLEMVSKRNCSIALPGTEVRLTSL